jgi:PAS domain S-box-containing protein
MSIIDICSHSPGWLAKSKKQMLITARMYGQSAHLINMLRNIKSPSVTLSESEEKYRALFNCMTEGFALHEIITNDQGTPVDYRFVEINPSFERLTATRKEDIIGKTVLEIFPDIEKVWIERYGRIALTGTPESFIDYNKDTERWYDVSAYSPAHGQFACVFSDVTAVKQLEAQLLQSQKMESIGTLAGGVAHDFNNILTVIMGACAMLQMKLENDPELGPFISQILTSSERAAKLTHNLLAFSRKQAIKPFKVDVNDIVSVIKDFLERIIGEDITLETCCCTEPLPVCADRGQIEQVLMNLTVNARDAMPDGGVLRLETARVDSRDHVLELEGCPPGFYAQIAVTDDGFGMDAVTRARVFDPFFTTKEIGYGTGLGLSMAYGIIKQHNGTIKVYSEPGEGTVFRIYLPLHGPSLSDVPETGPAALQGGTETILLVEDDPTVRASSVAVLECVGYNVICAANGEEAIASFKRYGDGIALVILDVIMPGMNGNEIYGFLKVMRADVKILFVSGYTAEILNRKGVISDEINFLSKPLKPHLFLGKVRELIEA